MTMIELDYPSEGRFGARLNDYERRIVELERLAGSGASLGRRNMLDNGAMQIYQRQLTGGPASISGYYTVDRWKLTISGLGAFSFSSWQQGTNDISGVGAAFPNKAYAICATANASPASGAFAFWEQFIEGQNCQNLRWGSAGALPLTWSGWLWVSDAGTYYVEAEHFFASKVASYPLVLPTSGWNYVSVTFPPYTAVGIPNNNGAGLSLRLWLGAGTTFTSGTWAPGWHSTNANRVPGQFNIAGALNRFLVMTGMQLEAGPIATPFEQLSYADDLRNCLRTTQKFSDPTGTFATMASGWIVVNGAGVADATTLKFLIPHIVPMRVRAVAMDVGTIANLRVHWTNQATPLTIANLQPSESSIFCSLVSGACSGTVAAGTPIFIQAAGTAAGYIHIYNDL